MRILFCGDVVGRSGRKTIQDHLPRLRNELNLDFVIVNGENAASGFGLNKKICEQFISYGADVVTGGDHCFDQKEVQFFIRDFKKLLRPANLPDTLPGVGFNTYDAKNGKRVLVIHLLAQVFVKLQADSPFDCIKAILEKHTLGRSADAIVLDFHGEATSERMAMGHYVDGRVSLVTGSHTHVPTADTQILPGGTAYQTDAGMCGDYDSVIGFDKDISVASFLNRIRAQKMVPAGGEGTLCGTFVETDDATGLAKSISQVRVGGRLQQVLPAAA